MRTKKDKMEGITFYTDKSSPYYSNQNGFYLYIGKGKKGKPWLRWSIKYTADDWLFIKSFKIKADNETFEKPYAKFDSDHSGGKIWEWYDENLKPNELNFMKKIISSKSATIRLTGNKYYKDKTITSKQKRALQNILDAYEALHE